MSRQERKQEKEKKGGFGTWIYRIIVLALLGVMVFSGYNLYKIFSEYHEGTVIYDDLADTVGAKEGTDNSRLHLDWDELKKKNEDIVAWIRCKGTVINYPVVQGNDNSYYLYRTFTGESNGKGSIFVDYRCETPFKDFNTVMYGHRMKDGSMFKPLISYFGSGGEDFYHEHPTMELYTPEKDYDIEIFAVAKIDATDEEWYRLDFKDSDGIENPDLKQQYLDRVIASNELAVAGSVPVGINNRIVMMSTCTAELDEYRQVVWGKLTEVPRQE